MTYPETIADVFDMHEDDDWVECWNCSGEGGFEDECECTTAADQCFCETSTPRKCPECKGMGGWTEDADQLEVQST